MKQERLKKIINDANGKAPREIIVINGYAFYKSSGSNSGMGGVWLPFLGIPEEKTYGLGGYALGDFTKPPAAFLVKDQFPEEQKDIIRQYFGEEMVGIITPELAEKFELARFGNLECMLISLALDPTSWDKEHLAPIKKVLQEKYSDVLNCINTKYIIKPEDKSCASFNVSRNEKELIDSSKKINILLSKLGKKFDSDNFPEYDPQRIQNYKINTDEKTASPPKIIEEKDSPSTAADLKKTAGILEQLLKENEFQKMTISENKLTVDFSGEFKKKSHKISLHIDLPVLESESKNNPAAGILEELLILAVDNETVKIDDAIFQKIDLYHINLDGKPVQRITVHLDGDIGNDPAKTQKLINFIYGLNNTPLPESSHRSSSPDIKFDGLTLDKTPLFKTWSSSENIKAVSKLDKFLQSYLELLFAKSATIKEKFNRDGSPRTDAPQLRTVKKGKEKLDLYLEEHKFARSLLKILREDHLPKSKLDQFVKLFEANKDYYFKVSPTSSFPLFKPTNVRDEIEDCLKKNSLLAKAESPAPELH